MSESRGRDLNPSVDGIFYETFGFGTFFSYHNFQNKIDAWESTVHNAFITHFLYLVALKCRPHRSMQETVRVSMAELLPGGETLQSTIHARRTHS